jgi:hypothetical protein
MGAILPSEAQHRVLVWISIPTARGLYTAHGHNLSFFTGRQPARAVLFFCPPFFCEAFWQQKNGGQKNAHLATRRGITLAISGEVVAVIESLPQNTRRCNLPRKEVSRNDDRKRQVEPGRKAAA